MKRERTHLVPEPGQDSFLDVVANLVGILIILVMVVAAHAKSAIIAEELDPSAPELTADVDSAVAAARQVEAGVLELEQKIGRQKFEIAYRNAERDQIQKLVLLAEEELAKRREQMSDEQQAEHDLAAQVQQAKSELAQVKLALAADIKSPPAAIPHLPTPMAKTVFTSEVHFRLLGGRLVYVPLTEMVERMQADAPSRVHRLKSASHIEETLPVVQGFVGKYILRRADLNVATKYGPVRQSLFELERLWLEDVEPNLGEPLAQALQAGSQFRSRLAGLSRERDVITVWVYPDSFDEFRTLKAELFQAGYLTAARPLPLGVPIGGAPAGSRSAAE